MSIAGEDYRGAPMVHDEHRAGKGDVVSRATAVSIVMPSYQQVRFLEESVRSVLEQDVDVELRVLDPGSTDGSRELLQRLASEFGNRLILELAPDSGQSDAVNRGMAQARGRVLGWLNSDDRLQPGALARVLACLPTGERPAWIYGRAAMIDADGNHVSQWIAHYKGWRARRFSRFKLLTENFIPQMAVFWNRAMWDAAGPLDTDKHFDMDYDLWLRFARVQAPIVLDADLAAFRVHAGAKSSCNVRDQLDAAYQTARRHAGDLGWRGSLALVLHRVLRWRTQLSYRWVKPR